LGELRLAQTFDGVTRGDVTDLVPEHTRELRLVRKVRDQPACHEDLAVGQGERVDCRIVHHGEETREARQPGVVRQRVSYSVDISLQGRVIDEADRRCHFARALLADPNLLLARNERELVLAGRGVLRAASNEEEQCNEQTFREAHV
jgi:hypothetical protein